MARARNIKPGLFKNEILAEQSIFTRLLFIGLWTLADREGRLEDRPKRIKLELFPCDSDDVEQGLSALSENGFIVRYEVNNVKIIEIVNFLRHQTPHGTEKDSVLPAIDGSITVHQRDSKGYVSGKKRPNNVIQTKKHDNPPLESSESTVTKHPDSLNPDSNTCAVGTADVCVLVFDHWKTTLNHPMAKLDKNRKKVISERLKDGYSIDDLKTAINGCKNSEWHMGKNDRSTVFDDLELILRNAGNVDKFIGFARQPQKINVERRPSI